MQPSVFYMEPTPSRSALAATVAAALQAAGLVQRNVADETGIPLATLNRRLKGTNPFNVIELGAIADMLGTKASALLAEAERKDDAA